MINTHRQMKADFRNKRIKTSAYIDKCQGYNNPKWEWFAFGHKAWLYRVMLQCNMTTTCGLLRNVTHEWYYPKVMLIIRGLPLWNITHKLPLKGEIIRSVLGRLLGINTDVELPFIGKKVPFVGNIENKWVFTKNRSII